MKPLLLCFALVLAGASAFGQITWTDPGPKPTGSESMTLSLIVGGQPATTWAMWEGLLSTGSPPPAGDYRVDIVDGQGLHYVNLGYLTNGAHIDTAFWSVTYPEADPVGSGLVTAFWSGFLLSCGFYGFGWKMRLVRQIGRGMPDV